MKEKLINYIPEIQIKLLCKFVCCNLFLISTFGFVQNLHAKKGEPESKALYVVPTSPELVDYSRFEIDIVKPYLGNQTQEIAYVFPEVLVGQANQVIKFTRVPGTINQWESSAAQAFCTITGSIFSCNIILNKKSYSLLNYFFSKSYAQNLMPEDLTIDSRGGITAIDPSLGPSADPIISRIKSIDHLNTMNLNPRDLLAFEQVVHSFFSNEPAGILSYEFE